MIPPQESQERKCNSELQSVPELISCVNMERDWIQKRQKYQSFEGSRVNIDRTAARDWTVPHHPANSGRAHRKPDAPIKAVLPHSGASDPLTLILQGERGL